MRSVASGIRAACVLSALLLSATTVSARSLVVDLNGDRIADRVKISHSSSELLVRLSWYGGTQHLATPDRVMRVIAADVDGDGDQDLVARTARRGLQVWLNHGRGGFSSARIRAAPAAAFPSIRRAVVPGHSRADRDEPGNLTTDLLPGRSPILARAVGSMGVSHRYERFRTNPALSGLVSRGPPAVSLS